MVMQSTNLVKKKSVSTTPLVEDIYTIKKSNVKAASRYYIKAYAPKLQTGSHEQQVM